MGYILLEGGAEFGGLMSAPDTRAMELAGGLDASIRIIPTAAAPDGNHVRAGMNGVTWFRGLGARDVSSLNLVDKTSANNKAIAESLQRAKLIYLLGGFPGYLGRTLKNSLAWRSVLEAYQGGAVVAGSSAGAMVLCRLFYDPDAECVVEGLGLVPNALILPHHNTFGAAWVARILSQAPDVPLLGIDERTGLLDDGNCQHWSVLGRGAATLYRGEKTKVYQAGETFSCSFQ